MTQIFQIGPLPDFSNGENSQIKLLEQIREVFKQFSIQNIEIKHLDSQNQIAALITFKQQKIGEALEFKYQSNRIPELYNAQIKEICTKKQQKNGSSSYQPQQLSLQDHTSEQIHPKIQQIAISLTDPSPDHVAVIQNCPFSVFKQETKKQIIYQLKKSFSSLGRTLFLQQQGIIMVQFDQQSDYNGFKTSFEGSETQKFLGLDQASVGIPDSQHIEGFGEKWIQQQKGNKSGNISEEKRENKDRKYLHEQMLPKMNKITSMQAQFIKSTQCQQKKLDTHEIINEQLSRYQLESRNFLQEGNQDSINNQSQFILGQNEKQQGNKPDNEQIQDKPDNEQIQDKPDNIQKFKEQNPLQVKNEGKKTMQENMKIQTEEQRSQMDSKHLINPQITEQKPEQQKMDNQKTIFKQPNDPKLLKIYNSHTQIYWIIVLICFMIIILC